MKMLLFIFLLLSGQFVAAAEDHDHHDHKETESEEGPHQGHLLRSEELTLEMTIYEHGVAPEMRVYAYHDGQPVNPEDVTLSVILNRLGGEQEIIDFTPEQDYLLGGVVITEPHSYEVEVSATFDGEDFHWHYDNFEGRVVLTPRLIAASGIRTEIAEPQVLAITNSLYGVIAPAEDRQYRIFAPYPGIVETVYVNTGDNVKKGQKLVTVRNQQTLKSYDINSPASGQITKRNVQIGDHSAMANMMEISDLSQVWVDMSMFPKDIEQLRTGMSVVVKDLHGHEQALGKINYIAPVMTGGHIASARAVIDNKTGYWRPGMHVNAEVMVEEKPVALAVKKSAIQQFRDKPVVFIRVGDTFEVRMVEMGRRDETYVEITSGLTPQSTYVTDNSYLLRAEVLKAGATHAH
ncbi:putative Co/Zn/Cd efflux system membrane fusion protein [Methylophaga frappieri]|uniref:Putative Co/Zn/Cd efflux system membrane fusion protein n=1 Tax=Methylophaga frappieri (strain ATCC BAA-2434 / DSM 25690 / JAM7) TaxID=754477 RepID=I1YL91_METFJ|nr:efflux RND transporter periplasmic adaptor subunit [Methylophaga frappieri]AFJ03684.1 putative Co/Zn/Cd efflux system membrane fusion protein [Methylophaga frappieri]